MVVLNLHPRLSWRIYSESPKRKPYLCYRQTLDSVGEERVGIVRRRSLQPGAHACSVDSNGVKPQMRDSDVREWQPLSPGVTAFTLSYSAKNPSSWHSTLIRIGSSQTRTMPEMEKGRPPENKRSRKPAHPVKREINQEMKVRVSLCAAAWLLFVQWDVLLNRAITSVRTQRLPAQGSGRVNCAQINAGNNPTHTVFVFNECSPCVFYVSKHTKRTHFFFFFLADLEKTLGPLKFAPLRGQ